GLLAGIGRLRVKLDRGARSDADSRPDSGAAPGLGAASRDAAWRDAAWRDAEPDAGAWSRPGGWPDLGPRPQPRTRPNPGPRPQPRTRPNPEPGPQPGGRPNPAARPEPGIWPQRNPGARPQPGTWPNSGAAPEARTGPIPNSAPQPGGPRPNQSAWPRPGAAPYPDPRFSQNHTARWDDRSQPGPWPTDVPSSGEAGLVGDGYGASTTGELTEAEVARSWFQSAPPTGSRTPRPAGPAPADPTRPVTAETGDAAGGAAAPSLVRSSSVMALGTLASRVTGLLRSVVLVYALGVQELGNAYNYANTLPNTVYNLAIGGILTSVIVPLL